MCGLEIVTLRGTGERGTGEVGTGVLHLAKIVPKSNVTPTIDIVTRTVIRMGAQVAIPMAGGGYPNIGGRFRQFQAIMLSRRFS